MAHKDHRLGSFYTEVDFSGLSRLMEGVSHLPQVRRLGVLSGINAIFNHWMLTNRYMLSMGEFLCSNVAGDGLAAVFPDDRKNITSEEIDYIQSIFLALSSNYESLLVNAKNTQTHIEGTTEKDVFEAISFMESFRTSEDPMRPQVKMICNRSSDVDWHLYQGSCCAVVQAGSELF